MTDADSSCELLSKCIFGISFTIRIFLNDIIGQLWIAFKMYLWHIVYNFWIGRLLPVPVVNCFQNVSLAYRLQFNFFLFVPIFMLWIAFKMYLWHIVYNESFIDNVIWWVVNCFQNVSLAYRLQSIFQS